MVVFGNFNCYWNSWNFHHNHSSCNYDENWTRDMYLNVCVCAEFWAARNGKKVKFGIFQAQPASVRVISSDFVCKSIFGVISMTKMVILDQSKPISLYLKKKLKIEKSKIVHLLSIKTEITQVYNPF